MPLASKLIKRHERIPRQWRGRINMTLINLRDVKEKQTNQDRAGAAIETYHAKPDELVGPSPGPVSKEGVSM